MVLKKPILGIACMLLVGIFVDKVGYSMWIQFGFILVLVSVIAISLFVIYNRGKAANEVDWGHPWINVIDGLLRLICRKYHRLTAMPSIIPLPKHGAAVVVANHISGLDPLLMIACCRRPLRFLIAREEYNRIGLRWLFKKVGCIPVDRKGKPERALREALKALQAGEVVALFPQGGIHQSHLPPKRLKGGAVVLAKKSGAPIYSLHISGIKAEGHVFLSLLIPSKAHIVAHPPFLCEEDSHNHYMQELAHILHNQIKPEMNKE